MSDSATMKGFVRAGKKMIFQGVLDQIESKLDDADGLAHGFAAELGLKIELDDEADTGANAVKVIEELQRQIELLEDFGG